MNANLLTPNKDPMGYAIADYFSKGKAGRLRVFSSQFDEDEIPVDQLFRTFDEMPVLEQKALELVYWNFIFFKLRREYTKSTCLAFRKVIGNGITHRVFIGG